MRRLLKNNFKTILAAIGLLIASWIVAFLFEDYYRQFVRFLFKFFNGDRIQFVGKNFHLFPSYRFVISSGFFTLLSFLFLRHSSRSNRLKRICINFFVCFISTILITALDSRIMIIECTACDDGIRQLTFNEISYDNYFIISLATGIFYLLTRCLVERK